MIIIVKYQLKKDEAGREKVTSYEINACPVCGHALIVIGTRERRYIDTEENKQTLIIRRLRCKDCQAIHHELPNKLMPYKRHCAETIEKVVAGAEDGMPCEGRTIQRIRAWWAACSLYFESVLASLKAKYGVAFTGTEAPREIVRAVANAHLWLHTRSVSMPA